MLLVFTAKFCQPSCVLGFDDWKGQTVIGFVATLLIAVKARVYVR